MLKTAPDPVDIQDLQFKLHCRLKVFENADNTNFSQHCSLVACASRFGLIFVGTNTTSIQVIQVKDIEKYTKCDGSKADYPRRNLSLVSRPSHLSVNCEHTILAIVIEKNYCPCALFYNVKSFWQQEVVQVGEVRLSPTPRVSITEVNWNPALATIFTVCKSDGSLGVYEIKSGGVDINELPPAAGVTCFSWSPKGKQIAVGSRDGKITQLKPDLKAVKMINAPPIKETHSLLSLQWVSNYQFIGVFQPSNPDGQSLFVVIDAPKSGEPTYINYDDICYSNGSARPVQYYTVLLQTWNILMAASSNSMEVGILGNSGESWTQWIMGDAARAELPLSSNHQETLPIGCALEIGNTQPVPWGESNLPPAPFLLLLSHHGMLCCFSIINLKDGIPTICTPPDLIKDTSGLHHFVFSGIELKPTKDNILKDVSKVEPLLQVTPELPSLINAKAATTNISANTTPTPFKAQAQVTPSQGLNLSKAQAVNLFGGQATLTPITQASKIAQPPVIPQYQSLFPSFSHNDNKTAATSTVHVPVISTLASPTVPKPVVTVSSTSTFNSAVQLEHSEAREDSSKSEITNIDLKAEEEAEKIFAQMVKEECIFLECELQAVLHHGKTMKLNLGSDQDKTKIIESTKVLEDFFHEVLDICVTQNSEVHILKQNLLQSWAWYEEAKSRHLASQDESMMILMRAQPLDSASEKQLADIQHTNYYLESQISQAHVALDEQWESFQDYCKKTHKIQIPTMEMIFQTMVKHNAILRKQSYVLKDIATRLKNKSRSALGPSLLLSVDDMKDLPDELKRLRMNPDDICQIQYEHVTNRMKNFTKTKADNLRSFLKKRDYSHISAVKPQLSTSVIQASPSSKLKQYSFLMTKTPVSKELPQKKLGFEHSTPKPATSKCEPVVTTDKSSTGIEGLQNFALKFEAKHFPNLNEIKSFAPVTKNVIVSSPNSAFVSTVTPATVKPGFLGAPATVLTMPSVGKTTSFVTVTTSQETGPSVLTISSNAVPKSFSFVSSSSSMSSQEPSVNIFSSSGSKPPVSSTTEVASASIFGTPEIKNTTSGFNMTTKPSPLTMTGFNLTPSTKSTTNVSTTTVKTPVTSSHILGSATVSTSTLSFGTSASNIFGLESQKLESSDAGVSTSVNKPFIFSKAIPPVGTTPQNVVSSKLNNSSTSTSFFATPESSASTKVTTSQLSLFSSPSVIAPKNTTSTVASVVSSSSIFGLPTTSSISPTTISSTQSSIFGGTVITSSTPSTVFAANSTKSLFASVTPTTVISSPAVVTTTISSTAASTVTTTSTSNIIAAAVSTSSPLGTTSASSIFGTQMTPKASTLGSVATTNSNSSTFSTFASTAQSNAPKANVFGSTTTNSESSSTFSTTGFNVVSTTASKPLIFGSSDANTSKPSIFGGVSATTATSFGITANTTQSSIFGAILSTPTSTFGVSTAPSTQTSLFGAPLTSVSGFGPSTVSTTQSSIFGTPPTATSAFGTPITTTTQSVFGTAVSTSSSTLFGAPTPSTTQSVFGTSNQTPIFGTTATSTAPQSIFGNAPAVTTTQSQGFGVFGDGSQKSSVFGNASTGSTQPSIFGTANQPSGFGSVTSTTNSVFGQNQATNTFGQSVFGSSGNSFSTPSAFGSSASTFGQSSGSIFGSSAPSTTSSTVFGGSATTGNTFASSGTVFGAPASSTASPFGSSSAFSPNTTQPSSFSSSANSGSFGFGSLNVGSTATTSSSGFGSAASNPFGSDNKTVFGSPSTASSSNPIFGSNSGSVFGTPTQNFAGTGFGNQSSPFGQQSTFGQTSFSGNSFAQSTSGPFSGGSSATVGQTGFGTGSTFQKPGFGSSPVFGGTASFGNAPSFGGAPSFGSPATFGSPPKMFGSASPGFGAATSTQSTAFGNMANQATVGFGNLAQQAANSASSNAAFSGSSSFSSWR